MNLSVINEIDYYEVTNIPPSTLSRFSLVLQTAIFPADRQHGSHGNTAAADITATAPAAGPGLGPAVCTGVYDRTERTADAGHCGRCHRPQ